MADLSRLLNPRTIAVIGGKECERVVEQCDKFGFNGTIWPVHPKRGQLGGRNCFRAIEDQPEPPDAAFVAVNRERSIDVVAALAKRGAGGAICYAAGFAEADAESEGSGELQERLIAAAGDMPVIGPNCYGFINALESVTLWPDQHGLTPCATGVGIVMQSSNVAINLTMQKRGLPIAMMMTAGNQAQLGLSELGLAMVEDERITALGVHIEGLDDVKAFERLALRARKLRKPIVALKVGKSDQARAAAMTHTASLAGSDAAHDALFNRLGVARAHSIEAFLEMLKLLHCGGPLGGNEVLSLSCSGGEAALMADAAEGRSVAYRPYAVDEEVALKAELGDIVTVANPLDYNTFIWGDWAAMTRMFEAALAPKFDLTFLVMDFPRADYCDPDDWENATDAFVAAVNETGARATVVSSLPETMPEEIAEDLTQRGIAPLCGLDVAVEAAEAAAIIGAAWRKTPPPSLLSPRTHCHPRYSEDPEWYRQSEEGSALDLRCSEDDKREFVVLNEHQSKTELAEAGLCVPKGVVIADPSQIETAMVTLQPPLALKALGVAHKSEAGAVRLGLAGASDVERELKAMSGLAKTFLLEEMAPTPLAELIIGVTRDPVCGPVLTIGAGGVLTELLDDTVSLLLPSTETDIRDALALLKIGRLLEGYRNTDAADMDALIANILCIVNYAVQNAETLQELDVNPLFATQFGSIAVDALVVKRKSQ